MQNFQISTQPSLKQIAEIKKWLSTSKIKYSLHNWSSIEIAVENERIAIILVDEKVIGFGTWRSYKEKVVKIENVEIRSKFRRKGYGKELSLFLLQYFIQNGFFVVKLECSPPSSENFWKKFDFIDLPSFGDNDMSINKELYKIIVPCLNNITTNINGEILEIWTGQPYKVRNVESDMQWHLEFIDNTRKLKKPIIAPCHYNWRICWRIDNKILNDTSIKYFNKGLIDISTFIIIEEMPKIEKL